MGSEPHNTTDLFGHGDAEAAFLDAFRSGRLHHAWLIVGPKGIGKATLAYRIARYLFEFPDQADPTIQLHGDLSTDPAGPAAARVAAEAHPNLLVLKRPYDDKNKRLKTEIPVDEVRRTQGFFGTTAAEEGWRVCIIDSADDLNRNAANALLKTLEEPTDRGLYLIVCHNPGRLLATIRSRCRTLRLKPLEDQALERALSRQTDQERETHERDHLDIALKNGGGSVGKALMFLTKDGFEVASEFDRLTDRLPELDRNDLFDFANRLSSRDAENRYDLFCDLMSEFVAEQIRRSEAPLSSRAAWVNAGEEAARLIREAGIFNLDRKQTIISVMEALAEAGKRQISPLHVR